MSNRPLIGITYSTDELDHFSLWPLMFQGIIEAGGIPIAIDCARTEHGLEAFVARLDGLLLSGGVDVQPSLYGGADDPLISGWNSQRDAAELSALAAARRLEMPVLAICRGAQLLNVACGGTLIGDLDRDAPTPVRHRSSPDALNQPAHSVHLVAGTLLARWHDNESEFLVNSQHHQGIRALGPSLTVSATSPDGLVEGFELAAERLVGVQWHPEVFWRTDAHASMLLSNFVFESRAVPSRHQLMTQVL